MNSRFEEDLINLEKSYSSNGHKQKKRKSKYERSKKDRIERDRRVLRKLKEARKTF